MKCNLRVIRSLYKTRFLNVLPIWLSSICLITLCFSHIAQALPGDLDTSFDGDGKALNDFPSDEGFDIAIQNDGKIVVAGSRNEFGNENFAIARHNSNGSLDETFGFFGRLVTDFGSGSDDEARALAIQTDGKIVEAGDSFANANGNFDFALARYNSNGTLDTTFSSDGKVTTNFSSGSSDLGQAIALQPDGRIVMAGSSCANNNCNFALARYSSDGSLDSNFSSDGKVTTDFGGNDQGLDIAIQADGKIVVGGFSFPNKGKFALARYNPDGSLDTTFSSDGKVTTNFSNVSSDTAEAIAIQADGKIVVTGVSISDSGNRDFALARYNPSGSLDTTFSSDGKVTTDLGNGSFDQAFDVALQADGKIVVAGFSDAQSSHHDFALARYNSNGNLDTSFSFDGIVATDFSNNSGDDGRAVAIQKRDGRIVVAGSSQDNAEDDFALARYHAFDCNGIDVTILGTQASETINGIFIFNPLNGTTFEFADVIHGLGGNDTINGLGGDDIICGGGGSDTINGGEGNDTLLGQNSADTLDGGNGFDTCVGGGQSGDTFSLCETINTGSSGFSGTWIDITQRCNRSGQNPMCRVQGIVEVEDPGTESTAVPTIAAFYLSDDEILDENDRFLEYVNVPALQPGERTDVRLNVKLKGEEDLFGLFGIVVLDFFNSVPEQNEDNNVVVSPPIE